MRKPFKLRAAKQGKPFENSKGIRAVEFHVFENASEFSQLMVLFENNTYESFSINGEYCTHGCIHLFMSKPDLKPCPFCGSQEIEILITRHCELHLVHCITCNSYTKSHRGRMDAKLKWNNRVTE